MLPEDGQGLLVLKSWEQVWGPNKQEVGGKGPAFRAPALKAVSCLLFRPTLD